MLRILRSSDREAVASLFARRSARMGQAEAVAGPILDAVRKRGDAALLEYAKKFDRLEGSTVRVDSQRLETAAAGLSPKFREAVALASAQIREFAELQAPKPWMRETSEGIRLGQIVRPLEAVAAYIHAKAHASATHPEKPIRTPSAVATPLPPLKRRNTG